MSDSCFLSRYNKHILDYSNLSNKTMINGNIFWDTLGSLELLFNWKLLVSFVPWSRTTKHKNGIETLMLIQDKI